MARRLEFAAAVAALVLDVLALAMLLFAPIVPYCADPNGVQRNCENVGYTSIFRAGLDAGGWAFLIGMFLALLIAAVGALGESRRGWRRGGALLWVGAAPALIGCVIASASIGLFYLPAILAVALAAYASILGGMQRRRAATPNTETEGNKPVARR